MQFKDIYGNNDTKRFLIQTVRENRISHAQLFLGAEGCGKLALAVAYAQYISCENRGENDSCGTCPQCQKYQKYFHPDLHFVFPVVNTKSSGSKPVSDDFIDSWRKYLSSSNYHRLNDWYDFIGSDNAQGAIFAQESQEIIRKLSLKTYEGEYKIMIIWMPEKMNETCANKLLKIIEEPPEKTLFILVAENEEMILTTIRSRTQLIKISRLQDEEIRLALKHNFPSVSETDLETAVALSNGNYLEGQSVIKQIQSGETGTPELDLFSSLMRASYAGKYDQIIKLSDTLSKLGREKQKNFFAYCQRMIRECFMLSSVNQALAKLTPTELNFANNFAKFLHYGNIEAISKLIDEAACNIERNAYGKLVFTDLAIKISSQLQIKRQ